MVAVQPEQLLAKPFRHDPRRRIGPLALSIVGLLALWRLRATCETALSLGLELVFQLGILSAWWYARQRDISRTPRTMRSTNSSWHVPIGAALVVSPWLCQLVLRGLGQGTGIELVALSSFAWGTVFAALSAQSQQSLGTSIICSGFLTLMATSSSDHSVAIVFAVVWGALCLWWLASSHWHRAQRCQVSTVVDNHWQRPVTVLAACVVFALSAWSVAGRFPPAGRFSLEVAPTSGGTGETDQFARSGVGDGDALVAAREQAASFGAVESDFLLESQEASLFDLYSDTFGEPFRKLDTERAIALSPQQQDVAQPTNVANSDGASSSLTTQRRPGTPPRPVENRASDALLFWIGRPDMHLGLERFAYFDGVQWHADEAIPNQKGPAIDEPGTIEPVSHGDHTWFKARTNSLTTTEQSKIFKGARSEAIKFARLRSPRIPTASGMHSWHILQVNDASFFRVDDADNLWMPDRKSVPEYTVVRFVNRETDIQAVVRALANVSPANHSLSEAFDGQSSDSQNSDSRPSKERASAGQRLAGDTVQEWLKGQRHSSRWDTIDYVINKLKSEFKFDRGLDTSRSPDPLADFIKLRQGNDLMFATAAAVMLRELGLETRLVTGVIARGENRLGWTKEMAIYAQDTHAWVEICAATGCWIPLEPTPGYPVPAFRVTWRYWLASHGWTLALWSAVCAGLICLAYWQRERLFDATCLSLSFGIGLANDRQLCRWLLMVLDLRCRFIGHGRPAHVPPTQWYSPLIDDGEPTVPPAVAASMRLFFSEANRLWFGKESVLSPTGREACRTLWSYSNCRVLRSAMNPRTRVSEKP